MWPINTTDAASIPRHHLTCVQSLQQQQPASGRCLLPLTTVYELDHPWPNPRHLLADIIPHVAMNRPSRCIRGSTVSMTRLLCMCPRIHSPSRGTCRHIALYLSYTGPSLLSEGRAACVRMKAASDRQNNPFIASVICWPSVAMEHIIASAESRPIHPGDGGRPTRENAYKLTTSAAGPRC